MIGLIMFSACIVLPLLIFGDKRSGRARSAWQVIFVILAIALFFGGQASPEYSDAGGEEAVRSASMPAVVTRGDLSTPLNILIFLHGWPDNHLVWEKQIAHFCPPSSTRRILCQALVMPGFYPGANPTKDLGYDFDELAEMLVVSLRKVSAKHPEARLTLVSHDWGAWIGYLAAKSHPDLIKAMVP
eukprot:Hpha_TRINITY_DN15295_c0_g2::TRINITY_DN15295_c0_g2_i1::g.68401::m.68401